MLSQPTLGQILCVPYTLPLTDWLPCEGQLLSIDQYRALYSLLGGRFGGDGTHFALPNLRGKEPAPGLQWIIAVSGDFPPQA